MNYFYKLVVVLIIAVIGYSKFTYSHSNDSLVYSINSITIASEPDYPPYCFIDENDQPVGFAVDLFKAATEAVNIKVDIKIGIWNQIMKDLDEGRIDALPFVGRTPEREHMYDFTMPYLRLHGAIFVNRRKSQIESREDLKSRKLAVMAGDNAEEYIRRNKISDNLILTHTYEEAFLMLSRGEVDAVISQKIMGLELIQSLNLKNVIPINDLLSDFRQDFCFAVQKGNVELLGRLNEGLSIIIANKTYDEIHLKWFGPQGKEELTLKELAAYLSKILLPIIIVLSLVTIVVLRRIVKQKTKQLREEISQHEITNQKLHDHQLLLEKMERVSMVGGWEYYVKTKRIFWTNGVYDIYGISPEEFDPSEKGNEIKFYHPVDQKTLDQAFINTLEKGEPYALELRLTDAKGIEKWIRTSGQAEIIDGEIIRVYGDIMDITERKIAADKLSNERKRFKQILDAFPYGIYIVDKNYNIEFVNKSIIEEFGDVSSQKCFKYIRQRESPCPDCNHNRVFNGEQCTQIWKSPSNKIFNLHDIPLINDDGTISKLEVFQDITEQKRVEEALREQEEIFNHFMEHSPVYVFFKDKDIKSVKLSRNYEKMLHKPLSQLIGKSMNDLFPSDLSESMIKDDKRVLFEEKIITVDEELDGRYYTTIKFPIIINGEPTYLAGYTIDITERKKAETELLQLKSELERKVDERTKELNDQIIKLDKSQKAMLYMVEDLNSLTAELKREREKLELSNKELEAFSYSVSHDLRAPLRAIDGFSRIVIEDYSKILDQEGIRLLEVIRDNSQKMDKLISDLLNLSRVTRTQLSLSEVDMEGMAKSMYYEVLGNEDESKIDIKISKMPKALVDTTLIRLVWQNLIGNAIKYSKPKGIIQIEIGGYKEKDEYVYFVKDKGVGFNPDYKHKIFETFQRLHRADEFEGTGIGLSVVNRIVTRHGGRVWAEGVEGEGAIFWFSIPKSR